MFIKNCPLGTVQSSQEINVIISAWSTGQLDQNLQLHIQVERPPAGNWKKEQVVVGVLSEDLSAAVLHNPHWC